MTEDENRMEDKIDTALGIQRHAIAANQSTQLRCLAFSRFASLLLTNLTAESLPNNSTRKICGSCFVRQKEKTLLLTSENTLCPKKVVHETHGDNFVSS